MIDNKNTKIICYLDGGDVCGFVVVVVGVGVGGGGGCGRGGGRVHLVNLLMEILIPQPFQPPPLQTLVDCGVNEVSVRAVSSNSYTRSIIATSILPPPQPKILSKIPSKSVAATPSPGHFSPNPSVLRLIVMFSALATGRSV